MDAVRLDGLRTIAESTISRTKRRPCVTNSQTKPKYSMFAAFGWIPSFSVAHCTSSSPGASKISKNRSKLRTLQMRLNLKYKANINSDDK